MAQRGKKERVCNDREEEQEEIMGVNNSRIFIVRKRSAHSRNAIAKAKKQVLERIVAQITKAKFKPRYPLPPAHIQTSFL